MPGAAALLPEACAIRPSAWLGSGLGLGVGVGLGLGLGQTLNLTLALTLTLTSAGSASDTMPSFLSERRRWHVEPWPG